MRAHGGVVFGHAEAGAAVFGIESGAAVGTADRPPIGIQPAVLVILGFQLNRGAVSKVFGANGLIGRAVAGERVLNGEAGKVELVVFEQYRAQGVVRAENVLNVLA